jgi:hypothetical protein
VGVQAVGRPWPSGGGGRQKKPHRVFFMRLDVVSACDAFNARWISSGSDILCPDQGHQLQPPRVTSNESDHALNSGTSCPCCGAKGITAPLRQYCRALGYAEDAPTFCTSCTSVFERHRRREATTATAEGEFHRAGPHCATWPSVLTGNPYSEA